VAHLKAQLKTFRRLQGQSLGEQQATIDRLTARVEALKAENAALHAELRPLGGADRSVEDQIEELERANSALVDRIEEERARTSQLAQENEELLVNDVLYQGLVLELPHTKRELKAARNRYREDLASLQREGESLGSDGNDRAPEFEDPDFAPDASPGRPGAARSPRAAEQVELENRRLKEINRKLQEQVEAAHGTMEEALADND
jgi:chromosome segregation ATPase